MKSKLNVLFVTNQLICGGAERYTVSVANYLQNAGCNVAVENDNPCDITKKRGFFQVFRRWYSFSNWSTCFWTVKNSLALFLPSAPIFLATVGFERRYFIWPAQFL